MPERLTSERRTYSRDTGELAVPDSVLERNGWVPDAHEFVVDHTVMAVVNLLTVLVQRPELAVLAEEVRVDLWAGTGAKMRLPRELLRSLPGK